MATYNFIISGTNQTFEVKGPTGMTQEQAKAIFDKQVSTGALVGFVAGDILNSATQAAAGLDSATASLSQQIAGVTNLSGVSNYGTTRSLSAVTPGSFNVFSTVNITAAAAATVGLKLITTVITNPLTIGEFAKATPCTSATVGNLTPAEITAAMAAVEKVAGQLAAEVTVVGVGKYSFSCEQLERAGYVKTGTADKFLSQNQNTLTSVLESPAVWTGKSGVKSLQDIIDNSILQTQIQQDLMTTSVQQILQLGIDISKMTSAVAGAIAVNAAKNIVNTVAWVKNQPLPATTLESMNELGRAAAFGINLAAGSLNDATKRIKPEVPAVDTVNRQTVDAATLRLVGNNKVPTIVPQINNASQTAAQELLSFVNEFETLLISIRDKLISYQISGTVSQEQFDFLNEEYTTVKIDFNKKFDTLYQLSQQTADAISASAQKIITDALTKVQTTIAELNATITKLFATVLQTLSKLP